MTHLNESWYQPTDLNIVQDDWKRANERTGDPIEPQKPADVLSLEEFAFALINQLADDYGIYDDGSFTRAIWEADTTEQMQPIITQLQTQLLAAMKTAAGM
jgi:hypothetical protein